MKVKQLLQWIEDNNVDPIIDGIIKTSPQTSKAIGKIEKYFDKHFDQMIVEQNTIHSRIQSYIKTDNQENASLLLKEEQRLIELGEEMSNLNMIATFIEKHKYDI